MFFNKKKALTGIVYIAVFALASIVLTSCMGMGGFFGSSEEGSFQSIESFKVTRGDIYQIISTSGSVDSESANSYNMKASGEILSALEKGDYFDEGEILVEIDNSEGLDQLLQIERNLELSEISLKEARLNYQSALDSNHIAIQMAELNTKKSEESTKSALKSLETANESLELSYESAERALEEAEEMLHLAESDPTTTDMQLAQYESNVESAEEKLESTRVSNNSSQSQAKSSYEQSLISESTTYWNNLSGLQSAEKQMESTRQNIRQAEIQLELAEMEYESAKEGLDEYIIYAPYDGIVTSSSFKIGDQNLESNTISTVSDNFIIRATIGESDISKVLENEDAYISLDAYPDYQLSGKIEKIVPFAIEEGSIISFEIIVNIINKDNIEIFYGLSADVDIVTEKAEDVLYVPIQAVYTENGRSYVDVLISDKVDMENLTQSIKKTEITTGINDYQYIEVTSGLNEGNTIIISRV
jgi:HlyD family secretion protein